jgi:hypothetical protein
MYVIAMLLLTVVAPGAFVESGRGSGLRDLARSLQRSGTHAVAYRSTVDVGRTGPRASTWRIDDVRVRLPGVSGELALVGIRHPRLGRHGNDEIGYARLKNLPAYQAPLRVRYRTEGATVTAMAEADLSREARTSAPGIAFAVGCVAAALWALGWAVLALILVDGRARTRAGTSHPQGV